MLLCLCCAISLTLLYLLVFVGLCNTLALLLLYFLYEYCLLITLLLRVAHESFSKRLRRPESSTTIILLIHC